MSDAPPSDTTTSWDPEEKPSGGEGAVQRGWFAGLLVFAWEKKIWWIVPALIVLLGLGILVCFAQKDQIAPFFYKL
jgi:hypothetical protein